MLTKSHIAEANILLAVSVSLSALCLHEATDTRKHLKHQRWTEVTLLFKF